MQGSQMVRLPITAQQAAFLNQYAEAVSKLRAALQDQIDNNQWILSGLEESSATTNKPRAQTASEVMEAWGRLDQLNAMVWIVFSTDDPSGTTHKTVAGYLAKASENIGENKKLHSIFNRHIFESDLSR